MYGVRSPLGMLRPLLPDFGCGQNICSKQGPVLELKLGSLKDQLFQHASHHLASHFVRSGLFEPEGWPPHFSKPGQGCHIRITSRLLCSET